MSKHASHLVFTNDIFNNLQLKLLRHFNNNTSLKCTSLSTYVPKKHYVHMHMKYAIVL